MSTVWLVRHGRAAAGWDVDPDPPLDEVGRQQAAATAERLAAIVPPTAQVFSSPLLRCRQTAAPFADWRQVGVAIESGVAEIPSPDGVAMEHRVEWLRRAMTGTWADLGEPYTTFRDGVAGTVRSFAAAGDAVVFSHFVAINAVIGVCLGDDRLVIRSLDNCSVTEVRLENGTLTLVAGGHEADTLIR